MWNYGAWGSAEWMVLGAMMIVMFFTVLVVLGWLAAPERSRSGRHEAKRSDRRAGTAG